jgi:CTD small phosphatase-like protein 2
MIPLLMLLVCVRCCSQVHCSVEPLKKFDLTFQVHFNSAEYRVYVKLRPHLYKFLQTIRDWFEVIVFTASQKIYADKLLNILDSTGSLIHHRVFRDSCVCVDGNYLKDIGVLGRDLSRTVIVDNSVQAFGYQLDNGVPVESWFGEKGERGEEEDDTELLKLLPFLNHLRHLNDVRPLLKQTFKLGEFVHSL